MDDTTVGELLDWLAGQAPKIIRGATLTGRLGRGILIS